MAKSYAASRIHPNGEEVLSISKTLQGAIRSVEDDRLERPIIVDGEELDPGSACDAVRAKAALTNEVGRAFDVFGDNYIITELDDRTDELVQLREAPKGDGNDIAPLGARYQVIPISEKGFRFFIFPNESQHRGFPHCKVEFQRQLAGTFSLPDGQPLPPPMPRHVTMKASKLVRKHGRYLLSVWDRTRPDDQRQSPAQ